MPIICKYVCIEEESMARLLTLALSLPLEYPGIAGNERIPLINCRWNPDQHRKQRRTRSDVSAAEQTAILSVAHVGGPWSISPPYTPRGDWLIDWAGGLQYVWTWIKKAKGKFYMISSVHAGILNQTVSRTMSRVTGTLMILQLEHNCLTLPWIGWSSQQHEWVQNMGHYRYCRTCSRHSTPQSPHDTLSSCQQGLPAYFHS